MTANPYALPLTGTQYTRHGPPVGPLAGKYPPRVTIRSSSHMAQSSGMPLGDPAHTYGCFMTADSRGLPLTGSQLTSLGHTECVSIADGPMGSQR